MYLYCDINYCWKNALVCLYKCTPYRKSRCKEYDKAYDDIGAMIIPDKFRDKHGEPVLSTPYSRRVRRKSKQQKPKVMKRKKDG